VTGDGTVTSSPAGIACPTDCTQSYNFGQLVTLTAAAGAGSTFTGWTGACTGTGTCSVTVDAAKSVTATFTLNMYALTVGKSGLGMGTVTGTGISCGIDCSETVGFGTMITLAASSSPGSTFAGWSGGGCSGTGSCTVTVSAATTVTATFDLQSFLVNVGRIGNGAGVVSSAPAGIACGIDCTEMYTYGTMVTLSAAASTGSNFTGWGGACSGTAPCTLTVDAAKSVTATFTLMQFPLTVTKAGGGTGTVTSSPTGISCGTTCTQNIDYNTMVTLTATASSPSSTFGGWSGACTGTGPCTVTMTAARSVTATFNVATYVLDVTRAGTGGGTVTSAPAGINCPSVACMATYNYNQSVVLTAAPDALSNFSGWTGSGCSGTGTCTVSMTQARSVTATFTKKRFTLTITKSGNGIGTVSGNGLSCGTTCQVTLDINTPVTLTMMAGALNSNQSTFQGWAGAGCTGTGTCTFTITANTTVDARLRLDPNLMFTTSGMYDGNLGGLAGADSKCQGLAMARGLKGNYRAYLSTATVNAPARFTGARGWTRVDGLPVVNAIGEFGTTTLANPPILDEAGNSLLQSATTAVWTGTQANTTYFGASCNVGGDWNSVQGPQTSYGRCYSTVVNVIIDKFTSCASQFRLYCFGTDRAATVP
jgi:uncharacterized repeat protein (TIGR02543 family)